MASKVFELKEPTVEQHFLSTTYRYQCYWRKFERPGAQALLQWKFRTDNNSNIPKDEKKLDKYLPVRTVNKEKLSNPPKDGIQVTWIGHATVLVQFDGITILTDPLFRDFCGPEQAQYIKQLGYWRYRKAACRVEDIPVLDAVIISHNHFDHLDKGSVKEICEKHKHVKWYVPLGIRAWLLSHFSIQGENIHELTWGGKCEYRGRGGEEITFISVPSQHWCQRGPFDLNKTLWCSWVVKSRNHSFYFAGDTGYHGPLFEAIGKEYGPFSLAAIPIGAYEPRWILEFQHADPQDAVNIHKDIKSLCSIGIHWGTFKTMACEFFLEPPNKVEEIMGRNSSDFISLCQGETWVVGQDRERSPFMGIKTKEQME